MSPIDERRAAILRVLRGELSERTEPAFFDDDTFFLLVRDVESTDADWLMTMLRDHAYHRDARGLVALSMTTEGHEDLIVQLFAERGETPPKPPGDQTTGSR